MRVLIADDSPVACEVLQMLLQNMEPAAAMTVVSNGMEAFRLLRRQPFDLLLLDIEMPEMNGKQLLRSLPPEIPVILITYDPSFALESYEYAQVIDYVVKPVQFDRLLQALNKVRGLRADSALPVPEATLADEGIFVKEGYHLTQLDLAQVYFVEAMSDYIAFHVSGGRKHLVMMPLKEAIGKLPAHFVRVHRSYIVNLRHVSVVEDNAVVMNGRRIPVSVTYKAGLMSALKLF